MKINELLVENQQLDELNLKGLGTGIGKAIGGVAGGVVQGAKNVWTGMKQGYAGAQQALAPDDAGGTAPATTTPASTPAAAPTGGTSPAQTGGTGEIAANNLLARAKQGTTQDPAAQQTAPAAQTPAAQPADAAAQPAAQAPAQTAAADQQAKVGVGQINKIIPTLRTRDLQSVKKNVDATLAKKSAAKPAAPAAAPAAEPEDDNPNIVRGYNMQENKVVKFKSRFLGMEI